MTKEEDDLSLLDPTVTETHLILIRTEQNLVGESSHVKRHTLSLGHRAT